MNIKRRKFLKAAAAAGLAGGIKLFAAPYVLAGPLGASKLRTAVIGVWNQGKASVQPAATEQLTALVDVDDNNLANSMKMIGQISPETNLSRSRLFSITAACLTRCTRTSTRCSSPCPTIITPRRR